MSADEASLLAAVRAGTSEWLFAIEGGGSKTTLQLISKASSRVYQLQRGGQELSLVQGRGSNPNAAGEEGVFQVFTSLLADLEVILDDGQPVNVQSLIATSCAVAGMAGVGDEAAKQIVLRAFARVGFANERVCLLTDAALTLQLVNSDHGGAILIGGTGSVCFARRPKQQACSSNGSESKGDFVSLNEGKETIRTGGLGRLIGDKGSGYHVAMTAIRKALETEYGYGKPTALVAKLRELFQVARLTGLIGPIHNGSLSPTQVASACAVVFEAARSGDEVAKRIVQRAAHHLSTLVAHALTLVFPTCSSSCTSNHIDDNNNTTIPCTSPSSSFLVYVCGGMFSSSDTPAYIQQIVEAEPLAQLLKRRCCQCPAASSESTEDMKDGNTAFGKRTNNNAQEAERSSKRQKSSTATTIATTDTPHCCCFNVRPMFVNTAASTSPVSSVAILEVLRRQRIHSIAATMTFNPLCLQRLSSLPLVLGSGLRTQAQRQQSRLGSLTTEQFHPLTNNLSDAFQQDPTLALAQLHAADRGVEGAFIHFQNSAAFQNLLHAFVTALRRAPGDSNDGRVIFVGSGSSGRLGVELAASWRRLASQVNHAHGANQVGEVVGVMAGGALAFVRAKEGCEDSEESGAASMGGEGVNATSRDCVVLISASGSAKYNNGVARAAAARGAKIFYFFNSTPPPYTAACNKECGVKEVHVDVGPMAITGSTRLQAATLALVCLGATLHSTMRILTSATTTTTLVDDNITLEQAKEVTTLTSLCLGVANEAIATHFKAIATLIDAEIAVFSSPKANFYESSDKRQHGYVSYLASPACIREVMVDTSETSPTFSTNPPRLTHEWRKKKAEFRAYLVPCQSEPNDSSWAAMLSRDLEPYERAECGGLLLSTSPVSVAQSEGQPGAGFGGFPARPISTGNLVVGVLKFVGSADKLGEGDDEGAISRLGELFRSVHARGGRTALICVWGVRQAEKHNENIVKLLARLNTEVDVLIRVEVSFPIQIDAPFSSALTCLVTTLTLKQILNHVSNGAMIGMGKVLGNIMVDMSPSNNKLVDRGVRIIQRLLGLSPTSASPSSTEEEEYNLLYEFVVRTFIYKQLIEAQYGTLVPPPIPIVVNMLSGLIGSNSAGEGLDVDPACHRIKAQRSSRTGR